MILKAKNNIRVAAADAIKRLQTTHDRTTARGAIEETIQSADQERQEQNQAIEKRRLKAAKNPAFKKKAPTTNVFNQFKHLPFN